MKFRVEVHVDRASALTVPLVIQAGSRTEAEGMARAMVRMHLEQLHPTMVDRLQHRHPDRFHITEAAAVALEDQ